MKRLVSTRLRYKIIDSTVPTSYLVLVARFRQLDNNMRLSNETNSRGTRGNGTGNGSGTNTGSKPTQGTGTAPKGNAVQNSNAGSRPYNTYGHSAYIREKLRKEGRCYKYL